MERKTWICKSWAGGQSCKKSFHRDVFRTFPSISDGAFCEHKIFSLKVPSQMFGRILNTLFNGAFRSQSDIHDVAF